MKNTLFLLACIAMFSCKQTSEAEVKTAPTHQEEAVEKKTDSDLNVTSEQTAVTFKEDKYTTVYAAYLDVKAALVNTNVVETQSKISALTTSLDGLDRVSDATKKALQTIAASGDVKVQRVAFETISANVETILSKNIASGTIYKQYCPMAFNGKGAYWLSDSKEVRNPYFGDQMLKCGVVDKEIN